MRLVALVLVAGIAFTSSPASARIMEPAFESARGMAAVPPAIPPAPPKKRRTPRPDPRRGPVGQKVNPAYAGLAAAGGAGGGALIGATAVGISTLVLLGTFGAPTLPVTVTAAVIAIGIGLATPFLAGLGGGGALLLMDPRTKPGEWSGLMGCATSGCCAGADVVGGTVFGSLCGTSAPSLPGSGLPGIPGPDKPAEWTAGAAIAGLVGGTVIGGLLGWSVASTPSAPFVPITIGALTGAVLGSAVAAGVGGGIAEGIRK